jgi:hypothetical protein
MPAPTPFVPDVPTFLTLIGRNLKQHASKIPSWEALFSLTSTQLRDLGIEPPRNRRYLLRWREKFRNGEYGVGGDLKEVKDGVAEIKVVEIPLSEAHNAAQIPTISSTPGMRNAILNVPVDTAEDVEIPSQLPLLDMMKLKDRGIMVGPHLQHVKGTYGKLARLQIKEGLWEHRRGHKVDGGERRKAEVRAKRRSEERKTSRA